MHPFLTIDDLELDGRRVLLRADLNVPLQDGQVEDDFRIKASVPALERLRESGATVVVCSHLGRPQGPDPALSLRPVAERLSELAGVRVEMMDEVVGPAVERTVGEAGPGEVLMLENTRFEPGETGNDPELSDRLARLADCFVLDAFGSAHRAHASTVGVAERIRSAAGPLVVQEVEALSRFLGEPERPYIMVLGGAKVSDKLGVMRAVLPQVDALLVGGAMCFTLLRAEGYGVGESLVEEDRIGQVRELLEGEHGDRIILPEDFVVADRMAEDAPTGVVPATDLPDEGVGLDIGPDTAGRFARVAGAAESLFWNGPMGVFEWEPFRAGTELVATGVAGSRGFTVAGGGDTIAALRLLGKEKELSHLSTGGGAGLEFLEGKTLPGLAALEKWSPRGS
ncbi:MAG: phosphoglycerate kinase [Acidimicrobiia bacterium]